MKQRQRSRPGGVEFSGFGGDACDWSWLAAEPHYEHGDHADQELAVGEVGVWPWVCVAAVVSDGYNPLGEGEEGFSKLVVNSCEKAGFSGARDLVPEGVAGVSQVGQKELQGGSRVGYGVGTVAGVEFGEGFGELGVDGGELGVVGHGRA